MPLIPRRSSTRGWGGPLSASIRMRQKPYTRPDEGDDDSIDAVIDGDDYKMRIVLSRPAAAMEQGRLLLASPVLARNSMYWVLLLVLLVPAISCVPLYYQYGGEVSVSSS